MDRKKMNISCSRILFNWLYFREGTFVRKGTFRVKKGEKEENKENKLPEIKISSDGK